MTDFQRDFVNGACNEPQPYNWRSACRLRPGHSGDHRAPVIGGWVWRWTDDSVWRTPEAGRPAVVRMARKIGRRHYVKPSAVAA